MDACRLLAPVVVRLNGSRGCIVVSEVLREQYAGQSVSAAIGVLSGDVVRVGRPVRDIAIRMRLADALREAGLHDLPLNPPQVHGAPRWPLVRGDHVSIIRKESAAPRGVTLIEMLVVISILVLLAAVTIPNIRPALENRRVRETASMAEQYINAARVRAMEQQHYVGVRFARASAQPEACVQLQQVQLPPIYTGETDSAMVRLQVDPSDSSVLMESTAAAVSDGGIGIGDLIQLGKRGWNGASPTYRVTRAPTLDSFGRMRIRAVLVNSGTSLPWPLSTDAVPWSNYQQFAVRRVPSPSGLSAPPLPLPEQTCIDLYDSGTDSATFAGTDNVVLLFGPTGAVASVYGGDLAIPPIDRLYFLIGKRDRLPSSASSPRLPSEHEDGLYNWEDPNNLWLTISSRNGTTATENNAVYPKPSGFSYAVRSDRLTALAAARALARSRVGVSTP